MKSTSFRVRVDGGEEVVARMGPGRYFGELASLFGLRRSATARASTPAVIGGLTVAEFRRRMGAAATSEVLKSGRS